MSGGSPYLFLPLAHSPGPPGPRAAGPRGGGRLHLPQVRGSLQGWGACGMGLEHPGRTRGWDPCRVCQVSGCPDQGTDTACTHAPPPRCSQVDRLVALSRMRQSGAFLSTSEGLILQLVGDATHPRFKEVLTPTPHTLTSPISCANGKYLFSTHHIFTGYIREHRRLPPPGALSFSGGKLQVNTINQ